MSYMAKKNRDGKLTFECGICFFKLVDGTFGGKISNKNLERSRRLSA